METIKSVLKSFFNLDNFSTGLMILAIFWLLCVLVRELSYLLKIDEFIWSIVGVVVVFLLGFLFNRIVKEIKS